MKISTAGSKTNAKKIAAMVRKITESGLSVDEYFRRHPVPFSRPQYFRFKARLAAQGIAGLIDGRCRGNHRKLTLEAEKFFRWAHKHNPEQSLQELRQSLKDALGLKVSRSTISGFLRRVGEPIVWPRNH